MKTTYKVINTADLKVGNVIVDFRPFRHFLADKLPNIDRYNETSFIPWRFKVAVIGQTHDEWMSLFGSLTWMSVLNEDHEIMSVPIGNNAIIIEDKHGQE